MSLIAVGLVECFLQFKPTALEFNLHKGQAVYENRHIVPILVSALRRDLSGYLKLVLAPVRDIEEFNVSAGAVIPLEVHLVPQNCRTIENSSAVQVIRNLVKFAVAYAFVVVFFKLAFEVLEEIGFVTEDSLLVSMPDQLIDKLILKFLFCLCGRHG